MTMKVLYRIQNMFIEPDGPNLSIRIEESRTILRTYLFTNDVAELLNTLIRFWSDNVLTKKPCMACVHYQTKVCDDCVEKSRFLAPSIKVEFR